MLIKLLNKLGKNCATYLAYPYMLLYKFSENFLMIGFGNRKLPSHKRFRKDVWSDKHFWENLGTLEEHFFMHGIDKASNNLALICP